MPWIAASDNVIQTGHGKDDAMTTTTSVLSVRVSKAERQLLEEASEQARTSLSDFVRRKALEAAEIEVLERSTVIIPAEHWEAFEAWAKEPPRVIPALQELFRRRPSWER